MGVAPPPQVPAGVLQRVRADMRSQRAARGGWPPGEMSFSPRRTREFEREPLPLLLRLRERHGPVFTIRLLYQPVVFALGPEANHYMTVSHASNFRWRDGGMGDLIPAARRRPAHHRRRLPPPRPPDHAAGVPPGAARCLDLDHGGGGRARRVGLAARRAARPVHVDAAAGAPDRDARAVRIRPRPRRARRADGRRVRGGARLLGTRLRAADAARPGFAVAGDEPGEGGARPGDLRRDRAAPGERRARRGHPQPAARRRRTRTARGCRTASCATR